MSNEKSFTITPDEVCELFESLNIYISHTDARQVASSANSNGAENLHGLNAHEWTNRFAHNHLIGRG